MPTSPQGAKTGFRVLDLLTVLAIVGVVLVVTLKRQAQESSHDKASVAAQRP